MEAAVSSSVPGHRAVDPGEGRPDLTALLDSVVEDIVSALRLRRDLIRPILRFTDDASAPARTRGVFVRRGRQDFIKVDFREYRQRKSQIGGMVPVVAHGGGRCRLIASILLRNGGKLKSSFGSVFSDRRGDPDGRRNRGGFSGSKSSATYMVDDAGETFEHFNPSLTKTGELTRARQ